MTLKDYLKKHNITYREFAEKSGYTLLHIHNYLNKKARISKRTAFAFCQATGGECNVQELLEWNPKKTNFKEKKNEENINNTFVTCS